MTGRDAPWARGTVCRRFLTEMTARRRPLPRVISPTRASAGDPGTGDGTGEVPGCGAADDEFAGRISVNAAADAAAAARYKNVRRVAVSRSFMSLPSSR